MATVTPDLSPADLLNRFRGTIIHAAPGHPEVIILRVRDVDGGVWQFSTFYAEYLPSDPEFFLGKTIVDVEFERFGELRMRFSDDSEFEVRPEPEGRDDHLWTWHLLTPDELFLRFRPRGQWSISLSSDPL